MFKSAGASHELFHQAVSAINGTQPAVKDVSNMTKLQLYALFKQADVGPCEADRPGMFDPVGRAKYDAWHKLGSMSKDQAMTQYIDIVTDLFGGKLPAAPADAGAKAVQDKDTPTATAAGAGAVGAAGAHPVKASISDVLFPHQATAVASAGSNTVSTNFETILSSVGEDGVQHITLNRPKRGNAFNMQMWADLHAVFEGLEYRQHGAARAVVLSGANGVFSTGMDLTVFLDLQKASAQESCEARKREAMARFIQYLQDAISRPERCAVPVIAAVSGNCIGGAVDLITACDLRYCTKDAVFCVKETDLAIVADIGTLQRLPKVIPPQAAAEMCYTGRAVGGEEAKRLGLVLDCFESEDLMMQHVEKVTREIAAKSPITIRGVKRVLQYSRDHTVEDSLQQVKLWNTAYLPSQDLQQAMEAAISGQKPTFTGV